MVQGHCCWDNTVVLGHCWLEVVQLEACTWVVHHLQVHNLHSKDEELSL